MLHIRLNLHLNTSNVTVNLFCIAYKSMGSIYLNTSNVTVNHLIFTYEKEDTVFKYI